VRAVLVDTGPIVALLDRSDDHHEQIVQALEGIEDPLVTVWPVIVEAMYLLAFSFQAQEALFEILETGAIRLVDLDLADIPGLKSLMEKYRDLPMDLADAALVRVAERDGIRRVLTLDRRDFAVYRLARKGKFAVLPRP
jgi:predicted nucleic acid-binding protein